MPPLNYSAPQIVLYAAALFGMPAGAWAGPVAGLETLFYTPAERLVMAPGHIAQESAAAPAAATRLTGVVRRANGKGTVWVNSKPIPEGSPLVGNIESGSAMVDGNSLRVGEGVDTTTGERVDIVKPGAVTVGGKR